MSTHDLSEVRAILFDVFGSVVDWRTSLINDLTTWSATRGFTATWAALVADWRKLHSATTVDYLDLAVDTPNHFSADDNTAE